MFTLFKNQKFELGRLLTTPGILGLGIDPLPYLERHASGDWGDMCPEDKQENEYSLTRHLRLFSAYETPKGKIWIITEADRSATTILLPDEY